MKWIASNERFAAKYARPKWCQVSMAHSMGFVLFMHCRLGISALMSNGSGSQESMTIAMLNCVQGDTQIPAVLDAVYILSCAEVPCKQM